MHTTNLGESLKYSFDEVAALYNEVRPHYPYELFTSLIDVTNLQSHARLLEIGPGTGQATRPLAQKGYHITAIELGASLAAITRRELAGYKNVDIINGAFEDIALPPGSFDLVFAATAFHWIDPAIRFLKPHALLKEKGHLAIIHTHHVSDEKGDAFFQASQPIFDKYGFTDPNQTPRLPPHEELKANDLDSRLFKLAAFQLFPVIITYTARQYVQLLNTYSNHLTAPKEVQKNFYQEIEAFINDSFQGKVEKHFSMSLTVGEKI